MKETQRHHQVHHL